MIDLICAVNPTTYHSCENTVIPTVLAPTHKINIKPVADEILIKGDGMNKTAHEAR